MKDQSSVSTWTSIKYLLIAIFSSIQTPIPHEIRVDNRNIEMEMNDKILNCTLGQKVTEDTKCVQLSIEDHKVETVEDECFVEDHKLENHTVSGNKSLETWKPANLTLWL